MAEPLLDPQLASWQASDPGTLPPPGAPQAPPTAQITPSKEQIRHGMELAAAFLVVRHLIAQRLGRTQATGTELEQAHAQWQAHLPIWLRLAVPAIQAAMAMSAPTLTQADLEAAAVDYTTRLGVYLDDTSADALAEGLARQLGAKWDRQLAWERATAGYGLTTRQMAAWIAGVIRGAELNPVDPIPAASRAQLDQLLLTRADQLGADEAARAVESGKALAWIVGYQSGMFTPGTVKEWDCRLENTCPVCMPLHRQQQPPDAPFVMPDGSIVWSPTLHPGCMCTTRLLTPNGIGKRFDPAEARDWRGRWSAAPQPEPAEELPPAPATGGGGSSTSFEAAPGGPIEFDRPGGPITFAGPTEFTALPPPAPTQPTVEFSRPTIEFAPPPVEAPPAPVEAPPPPAEPEAPAAGAAGGRAISFFTLDEVAKAIRVGSGERIQGAVPWNALVPGERVEFGVPPRRMPWTEATPAPAGLTTREPGARSRYFAEPSIVQFTPSNRPYADLPLLDVDHETDDFYQQTAQLRGDVLDVAADPSATRDILDAMHGDEIKLIYQLSGSLMPTTPTQRKDSIIAAVAEHPELDPQLASAFIDWVGYVNPVASHTDAGEQLMDEVIAWEYDKRIPGDFSDLPPVQNLLVFDEFAGGDDAAGVSGNYRIGHVSYASLEDPRDSTAGFRYVHLVPDEDELGKRLTGFVSAFGVTHPAAT